MNLYDEVRAHDELQRALKSDNPEQLSRVLVANIWPLYSDHYGLLMSTIESLPVKVLARYPVLWATHPMTAILARTTRQFKPLMSQEAARTMSPAEVDSFTLTQMVSFRFSGDVAAALMFAGRLEDRILNVRTDSRERSDGPLWFYRDQIGVTFLLAGDTSRALIEFGTAAQLGALSKQRDAVRVALGHAALGHALRGSLDVAEHTLSQLNDQPPATAAHESGTKLAQLTAAALIAVERMDNGAEQLLRELGPSDGIDMTWPFALLARVRALLAKQRPEEALEAIQLADRSHPSLCGSVATDIINALTIEALAASDNARGAWRHTESVGQAGTHTKFAMLRLALRDLRFDLAHEYRHQIGSDDLSPGQKTELMLLSAWLELAQTGEIEDQTVAQIARFARQRDAARLLSTVPRQLVEQVMSKLSRDEINELEQLTPGLIHIEMEPRPTLTPSELRVLSALPIHTTTAAIAAAFHVSPNTIKSQLKALYRKLECTSREGAIKSASRMRIIADDFG